MPPLTPEEAQQVIDMCESTLSMHAPHTIHAKQALITLAALTAEPRGSLIQYVNPKSGNAAIFYRERGISSISPEEIAEWEMSEVESLYDAPPVPVLKPIELPKKYVCDKNGCDDDPLPSWQVMISCDEIIAAIRAAGYEVKP